MFAMASVRQVLVVLELADSWIRQFPHMQASTPCPGTLFKLQTLMSTALTPSTTGMTRQLPVGYSNHYLRMAVTSNPVKRNRCMGAGTWAKAFQACLLPLLLLPVLQALLVSKASP
jgi:hypothetical protein